MKWVDRHGLPILFLYIEATIHSGSEGYYWLGSYQSNTAYIHNSVTDGSNTYGGCNGFARRNAVGGMYTGHEGIGGSRTFRSHVNTAYADPANS